MTQYKDMEKGVLKEFENMWDDSGIEEGFYISSSDKGIFTTLLRAALRRIAEESIAAVVPDDRPKVADEDVEWAAHYTGYREARAHILEARDKYFGNV